MRLLGRNHEGGMFMKKYLFALLVAALAFAAAGTGGASTRSHQAAGSALISCGKTRTFGVMAPITGPAASIGTLQVKWVQFYVSQYNRPQRRGRGAAEGGRCDHHA